MRDPYEVLGVTKAATEQEIQKAYRKLASQWHPDHHPPEAKEEATQKFKEIGEAWEILGDKANRSAFDQGRPLRGGKPYTTPFDDLLARFFQQAAGAPSSAPPGDHIHLNCELELEDSLRGGKADLVYRRQTRCKECLGFGGKVADCQECQGSGVKIIRGAAMTVKAACRACVGKGKVITEACNSCQNGLCEGESQTLTFEFPQGVQEGQRYVYRGQGQPSRDVDGTPGNLFVLVSFKPHPIFDLLDHGALFCKVPLTYTQLVLGTEITVPSLDGDVNLKIPPRCEPGKKFRLKELGLPVFNNRTGGIHRRGDQFVEVRLAMPADLTDRQKEIIEELASLEAAEGDGNEQSV